MKIQVYPMDYEEFCKAAGVIMNFYSRFIRWIQLLDRQQTVN